MRSRIKSILRWSFRTLILLFAIAGIATAITGHLTIHSDDYLGYRGWGYDFATEWTGIDSDNGGVFFWIMPHDPVDTDEKPGWYHEHGSNTGEGQLWIMLIYGRESVHAIPNVASWGTCVTGHDIRWRFFHIDTWILATALLMPPVLWTAIFGISTFRKRRRKASGKCLTCGYDLRASTDRCPECGATKTVASKPT